MLAALAVDAAACCGVRVRVATAGWASVVGGGANARPANTGAAAVAELKKEPEPAGGGRGLGRHGDDKCEIGKA